MLPAVLRLHLQSARTSDCLRGACRRAENAKTRIALLSDVPNMPSADPESPDESFFNDLSQQAPDATETRRSSTGANGQEAQKDDTASKPKRIACVLCRKRKLRCDGARPTCGTCKRLSHDCAYDEVRKKSGPKRGYVKLLEARLRTSTRPKISGATLLT